MIRLALAALACCAAAATSVAAQQRRPSHCIALADAAPGTEYVHRDSFGAPLADDTVRINYVDHAMFLLETAGGLTAVTDFTGFIGGARLIPDVVTMNNAHTTHFTMRCRNGACVTHRRYHLRDQRRAVAIPVLTPDGG